ncbi:MAG: hypothetical protein Q4E89_08425 [Eubacteriales bacterium]|nr:hypothetical protein [Eubacteriales bacterium]
MDYMKTSKTPPRAKKDLSTPENLAERLRPLIGQKLKLSGKPRTDGSNFRKLITSFLLSQYMPEGSQEYEIIPPRKKAYLFF